MKKELVMSYEYDNKRFDINQKLTFKHNLIEDTNLPEIIEKISELLINTGFSEDDVYSFIIPPDELDLINSTLDDVCERDRLKEQEIRESYMQTETSKKLTPKSKSNIHKMVTTEYLNDFLKKIQDDKKLLKDTCIAYLEKIQENF